MTQQRPDPDKLLVELQRQQAKESRGHLKIFFGACAGVGKTFAMLNAAQALRKQKIDIVVGYVETHGRADTAELLTGLDVLPRKMLEYHEKSLPEFDLDAALARNPALILVDELAHSNVPGSRHNKRWQDVEELLKAGIDVYTTLNVQHLESLNDVVGHITSIRVSETIPDYVFDNADEVTLVDLPPDDLLQRLREGKVYLPEQAEHAVENFFRKGNLIALRELALRRMADRVDVQMREYRSEQSIQRIWQAKERIMVCVGPQKSSEQLIRKAYRLAARLRVDWLAVYIETPDLQRLSKSRRDQVLKNLALAQQLGADTKTLAGANRADILIGYAHARNVSKIIVGKPQRSGLSRLWRPTLSEQLIKQLTDVDIYIVGYQPETVRGKLLETTTFSDMERDSSNQSSRRRYLWSLLICGLVTLLSMILINYFSLTNVAMLFLLAVVITAVLYGRGPSLLASFISVAAFDFFFVPPRWSFAVSDTQYLLTFAVMLVVALITSSLASSLRYQARVAIHRERRTSAIYALSKELSAALTREQIVEISARHVNAVFQAKVTLLLPDDQDKIRPEIEGVDPAIAVPTYDPAIANWVYHNQQPAGLGTQTLPASNVLYLPLAAPMTIRGVMSISPYHPAQFFLPELQRLLNTFATQIALSLEHIHYMEVARNALLSMESERLRSALLNALSYDLRQPLSNILESSRTLRSDPNLADQAKQQLAQAIYEKTLRIHSLVTNLLDMARLQIGNIELNMQWLPVKTIVEHALERSKPFLGSRVVTVTIPMDLPLLHVDTDLIESTLSHLLENCSKFTTKDSQLYLSVEQREQKMWLYVDDDGPGLPNGMEERIFEKFTRGDKKSHLVGAGLGLAICRAIVEAHGGRISAENRLQGGARFIIQLPIESQDQI